MTNAPTLPSDRQLIDAARAGHDAAWAELLGRHEGAIRAILPARTPSAKRTLSKTLESLRGAMHESSTEGYPEIRSFRPLALSRITDGRYGPTPAGTASTTGPDHDQEIMAQAFARLPEPWQTVLWHSHVEQSTAAEVSPLVGRTADAVVDLVATAERGLTDAFLVEYADAHGLADDDAELVSLLGGHVRDALSPNDSSRVIAHLEQPGAAPAVASLDSIVGADVPDRADLPAPAAPVAGEPFVGVAPDAPTLTQPAPRRHTSDDSRRLVAMAASLPTVLPPAIAPGITGLTVQQHRRALANASRSFGADPKAAAGSDDARRAGALLGAAAIGAAICAVLALVVIGIVSLLVGSDVSGELAEPGRPVESTPGDPVTDDPNDDADPDPGAVSPTTEIELRPSGPANEIDLVMNAGLRADAVGGLESSLTTTVDTVAPIFAGGTGTIDVSITNDGADPVDANVELQLPRGVVLDDLASGDAVCEDPADDSPYCDVTVPPNSSVDLSVRLGLESTVVGQLAIDGDTLAVPFEAPIVATRSLVHNSVGRGDVVVSGNTVMTCDSDVAAELDIDCTAVIGGIGTVVNRWDVPMTFTGVVPEFGVANSSTAVLDISDTATVVSAHLFWAGDLEERGVSVPTDGQLTAMIATPTGEVVDVEATRVKFGEEDSTQYLSRVDVTDLIGRGGGGEYLVANIASVETQGSFGAWALVVVVDDDELPLRHRIVTDPFDWVAPQAEFTYSVDLPVPVVENATAQLDIFGLEGERGFEPETLDVAGESIGGENPFNSTIVGERSPSFENNLGVDIDAYDLTIDTPDGTLLIESRSDDDGIRLAVLGLTVDLET